MRSGDVDVNLGRFRYASVNGYGWSASSSSKRSSGSAVSSAYYLAFNATDAYHSFGPNYRWYSFPLRCLVSRGENYTNELADHLMNLLM